MEILTDEWRVWWDWDESEEIILWEVAGLSEETVSRLVQGVEVMFEGVDFSTGRLQRGHECSVQGEVEWQAWERLERLLEIMHERAETAGDSLHACLQGDDHRRLEGGG